MIPLKPLGRLAPKKIMLIFTLLISGGVCWGQDKIDIRPRLTQEQEFFRDYRELIQLLNNESFQDSLTFWSSQGRLGGAGDHQMYLAGIQAGFGELVRSPMLVQAIAYFLRTHQGDLAAKVIQLYYRQLWFFLHEMAWDPRFPEHGPQQQQLAPYAAQLTQLAAIVQELNALKLDPSQQWHPAIDNVIRSLKKGGGLFTFAPVKRTGFLGHKTESIFPSYPGPWRPVSYTGFIPGNKVTYVNGSAFEMTGKSYLDYISDRLGVMVNSGYATADGSLTSVAEYKAKIQAGEDVFSGDQFDSAIDHPAFASSPSNIFHQVQQIIAGAQQSLFVDIFFLGGTIGAAISKELVRKAEEGVKVFVIRDLFNHFGHRLEMQPVANYLRAYSELNPGKMVVVPAVIDQHPSGLPLIVNQLLSHEMVQTLMKNHPLGVADKIKEQVFLSPEARSDHSKVILADACVPGANKGLVGSKNWTDLSGGVTKDDVVVMEGPATCALQNHYVYDMEQALLKDQYRENFDPSAMERATYLQWHYQAYAAQAPCQSEACKVKAVVSPFDPLTKLKGQEKSLVFSPQGKAIVRIGENNLDGSVLSALDQVVQGILTAKTQVLIRNLLIFSQPVVNAIIAAVRANPDLRIYIVTDAFDYAEQRTGTEGFPNWFYLDQLYALNDPGTTRVHMRFFLPEYKHPELHQEFHHKSMSVDGFSTSAGKVAGKAVTIVGSANWDPLTLFGAFRESQAEIFDDEMARTYDASFWQLWGSPKVRDALPWEFTLPAPLDKVDKGLFISGMRQLIEPMYQVEIVYDL